jgi:hypothetical protein
MHFFERPSLNESEGAIEKREPRFKDLPPEDRALYRKLLGFHRRFARDSAFSKEESKGHERVWNELMFNIFSLPELPLDSHMVNKEKAEEYRGRFKLVPVFASSSESYSPKTNYGARGSVTSDPFSKRKIALDAPIGFRLLLKLDAPRRAVSELEEIGAGIFGTEAPEPVESEWEPVAVLGCVPDFGKNMLLIDQLQGGDTMGTTTTPEVREIVRQARNAFAESPEYALYEIARDVARRSGFAGVGLRLPDSNEWPAVRLKVMGGKTTVYDRVIEVRKAEAAKSAFSEANTPQSARMADYFIETFAPET